MKHLKWFSMFLVFALVFFGCGNDDDDDEFPPSSEPMAYVVNQLSLTISSVNTVTEEVLQDVYNVGNAPNDVQIAGDFLYILNTQDSNLQIIDLTSGVSDYVDLGAGSSPEKMAFVSSDTLYVTAGTADSVKVVDLASRTVTKEIPVGISPWGITATGGKAFVVNSNYDFTNFVAREGSVSVIDTATETVTQTIQIGMNPQEIALSPGGQVLVLCTGNYADVLGNITPIDPATSEAGPAVELNTMPSGIVVRDDGMAFVTFSSFLTGESGLIQYDTGSGVLTHSAANALLPGIAGLGMTIDSNQNLYIAVPDWDGSSTDKLLVLNQNDEQIGTYEVGGGGGAASFVAVRE